MTRILEKRRKRETQKDAEWYADGIIRNQPVAVPADLEEQVQAQFEDIPEVNAYFMIFISIAHSSKVIVQDEVIRSKPKTGRNFNMA